MKICPTIDDYKSSRTEVWCRNYEFSSKDSFKRKQSFDCEIKFGGCRENTEHKFGVRSCLRVFTMHEQ